MKLGNKAKRLLSNNKKLVIGMVVIGVLIMLPTALYVNTKHNKQIYQDNNGVESKPKNNSGQAQDPVAEQQVPPQTNSQPNNNSSKTTNNSTPAPKSTQQPTATPTPQYVAETPACSSSLRASAISTLKQGYQYQANKKDTDLQVWYSNNYQLSTYSYQQYQAKQAEYQAWLDNYIAIEIANKNASLSQYGACTPITRSELGV